VQIVAIDMCTESRAGIRDVLPTAQIAVDHWHDWRAMRNIPGILAFLLV